MGTNKRADPFFLAVAWHLRCDVVWQSTEVAQERYEIQCDCVAWHWLDGGPSLHKFLAVSEELPR